ncbi:MAG TPA: hypothetical protein VM735_09405 [Candidatus Kapabacteria bacterium]|nr:hypothetical protein [Candidatus Kapabacteria bacterium]
MQFRSARRLRWLASFVVLVGAILLFFGLATSRRDRVALPNGITVEFLGVTHGTNDFVIGNFLQRLLGDRIPAKGIDLGFTTLTRPRNIPMYDNGSRAWVRVSVPEDFSIDRHHWRGFNASFRNESGRELEVPFRLTPSANFKSNAVFGIRMEAYPRNEPKVTLRVGTPTRDLLTSRIPTPSSDQQKTQWAEFEFKNPEVIKELPTWNVQPLPATNYVEGLPVVLRAASASASEIRVDLPSSDWSIPECEMLDQEGNRYSLSSSKRPAPPATPVAIEFPASLGADRPWHVRLRIVAARGFIPEALASIKLPQVDFPSALRRRIHLSEVRPYVSITNETGEVFLCALKATELIITGTTTAERPYWAVLSAQDGSQTLGFNGYGWMNPTIKEPSGRQTFSLPDNVTNVTVELACPQVYSTDFYFMPSE